MASQRARYGGGDTGEFVRWFRGKVENFTEAGLEAAEAFAESGREATKHHISTRGTPWGRKQGRSGRIDTGNMIDSVDSRVVEYGDDRIQARFGWIDPGKRELYFALQEGGFTIATSGAKVQGIHAIADAYTVAREKFRTEFIQKARAR